MTVVAAIGAVAMAQLPGCASLHSSPDLPTTGGDSRARAVALFEESKAASPADPARVEALLRESIQADPYFGPARNNLGSLLLAQSPPALFEAASELEWASKLMPGQPEPRFNLGFAFESAGRFPAALAAYESAIEASPGYLPALQAHSSLAIRLDKRGPRTRERLEQIAMNGSTPQWRAWAREQLANRP